MAKMIVADLSPEEAGFLQDTLDAVMKEFRSRNINIDSDVLTDRMANAINSGERDYGRILALTLGAEAAPAERAN